MKIKIGILVSVLPVFLMMLVYDKAFAGWGDAGYGYPGMPMMETGFMGWFMILFWGLLLVGLILLVRWILQLSQDKAPLQGHHEDPLEILKKRLARGEIEIEEFQEKKQLLSEQL